jgi:hypothetical protein
MIIIFHRIGNSIPKGIVRVDPVLYDEPSAQVDTIYGHLSGSYRVFNMSRWGLYLSNYLVWCKFKKRKKSDNVYRVDRRKSKGK